MEETDITEIVDNGGSYVPRVKIHANHIAEHSSSCVCRYSVFYMLNIYL
jgi:hypothetical protein